MIKLTQQTPSRSWQFSLVILIILLATGCSSGNVAPTAQISAPIAAPTHTTEVATLPTEATALPEATVAPTSTTEVATLPAEATALPEATVAPTEAAPPSAEVSFSQNIAPILTDHCLKCHGGEKTREGYEVNSYDKVMAGSDNGQMIVPGDSAKSDLVKLIKTGKMPKKEPKLSDEQIRLISDWIDAGALNN